MLADPAVVAGIGGNKSLVKISQDGYNSEYLLRSATDEYRLLVRNTDSVKRGVSVIDRHNVQYTHTVFATSTTPVYVRKAFIVIENQQGDTLADPTTIASGLFSYLTASSNANITKLLNMES